MLIVNKGANNTLIVTLTEKSDVTYPYYLFQFTSDVTQSSKYFICQDLSTQQQRYNEFLVTESATEVLTSGTVELLPTGQYTYRVFGQYSSTNLSPANSDSTELECGRAKVIGTSIEYIENNGTSSTYTVYEPE